MAQDLGLEGAGSGGNPRSDLAQADDSERLARQLRPEELRLLPLPAPHGLGCGRHAAQQGEQQGEGVLDGGDDVGRRGVQDEDAASRGRGHVHVVDADTRPRDDRELWTGGQQLRVHLRGAAHEKRVGRRRARAISFSRGAPDRSTAS